jgi:hypothetical protein
MPIKHLVKVETCGEEKAAMVSNYKKAPNKEELAYAMGLTSGCSTAPNWVKDNCSFSPSMVIKAPLLFMKSQ